MFRPPRGRLLGPPLPSVRSRRLGQRIVKITGLSNNALHQTRRGGAVASRPVVEARLAGERGCWAGLAGVGAP